MGKLKEIFNDPDNCKVLFVSVGNLTLTLQQINLALQIVIALMSIYYLWNKNKNVKKDK